MQSGVRKPLRVGAREVVVVALALAALAGLASANLHASRRDNAALVCRSNMRALMRGARVYAGMHALAGPTLPVDALTSSGLVTERVGRCPLGGKGHADYRLTLRDGVPESVACTVAPESHRWEPD